MAGKWDAEMAEQEISDARMEQVEMQADMLEEIGDDFTPDGETAVENETPRFLCYAVKQPWQYELRDAVTKTQRRKY